MDASPRIIHLFSYVSISIVTDKLHISSSNGFHTVTEYTLCAEKHRNESITSCSVVEEHETVPTEQEADTIAVTAGHNNSNLAPSCDIS